MWLDAAMQCNALPRSAAVPDRNRSVSDNVQFHSCPGRQSHTQVPLLACMRGNADSISCEELAARRHSACHAGPSGRVRISADSEILIFCTRGPQMYLCLVRACSKSCKMAELRRLAVIFVPTNLPAMPQQP